MFKHLPTNQLFLKIHGKDFWVKLSVCVFALLTTHIFIFW